MASLIQQRFAVDRVRARALWILGVSVAMLVLAGLVAVTSDWRSLSGASILLWGVGLVYGLTELRRHRRILREFEAENGPGAGLKNVIDRVMDAQRGRAEVARQLSPGRQECRGRGSISLGLCCVVLT
jgi:hypothetical protein